MDNPKKDRNKSYYERNKERILERARLRTLGKAPGEAKGEGRVVALYNNSDVVTPKKPRTVKRTAIRPSVRGISRVSVFLLVLVGLMTSFLFHETAKFFFILDQNWAGAFLKAGILEGAAIAFTIMQGRNRWGTLFNGLMVLLIYFFGIWVVSYPIVSSAQSQQTQGAIHQKILGELESEVSKKEGIRDQYWKMDRVSYARKYDQSLDDLRNRLDIERHRAVDVPVASLARWVLVAGILFRILIMVSNFACIRYLRGVT